MDKYIKKYNDIFEDNETINDADPYGEETTEPLTPGSLEYKGDIIPFLKNLENAEIDGLVEDMLASGDLDEKMDFADNILTVIKNEFVEIYDKVEDDVRDLATS